MRKGDGRAREWTAPTCKPSGRVLHVALPRLSVCASDLLAWMGSWGLSVDGGGGQVE